MGLCDLDGAQSYVQDVQGGFQLEFVSISRVMNHMTCYNSSDLIGGLFI